MVYNIRYFLISFLLIAFYSCANKPVDANTYLQYITDTKNGLHQVQKDSSWEFEVQYKTPHVMALQETANVKDVQRFNSLLKEFGQMQYFLFRIKSIHLNDSLKGFLSGISDYLNFGMQEDFSLVSYGDTLPCSLYYFENTFPLSGYGSVSLGFDSKKTNDNDLELIFQASLFNSDAMSFRIKSDDIKKIPVLKY